MGQKEVSWSIAGLALCGCLVDVADLERPEEAPAFLGDSGVPETMGGGAGVIGSGGDTGSGGATSAGGTSADAGDLPDALEAGLDGDAGPVYAKVVSFKLWDATTDVVIDADFTSGDQIVLSTQACTAIEIIGNDYLMDGYGSIKKVLDGQDPGCTVAGVNYENMPPFAWEADNGEGAFDCATSLTQVGAHTLAITPYDGENCTGAVGTTLTVQFDVVSGV